MQETKKVFMVSKDHEHLRKVFNLNSYSVPRRLREKYSYSGGGTMEDIPKTIKDIYNNKSDVVLLFLDIQKNGIGRGLDFLTEFYSNKQKRKISNPPKVAYICVEDLKKGNMAHFQNWQEDYSFLSEVHYLLYPLATRELVKEINSFFEPTLSKKIVLQIKNFLQKS